MMEQSKAALPISAQKVQEAARALGLDITIVEMAASTRTAQDAAAACGCKVAQIVKSLLFRGEETGKPVLALVSGVNRLNEKGMVEALGEAVIRPDATYVRETTGFAIGGVPPIGHATQIRIVMDHDLLGFKTVWAAAGTPHAVFSVAPAALADAVSAQILKVT